MTKAVNKTLIGAFVVGALALAMVGILALGSGNLFRKSNRYVLYFSGSVKGLGLGAPVQLKGVTIGKVTAIHLVYDYETEMFLNRVAFEVDEGSIKTTGSGVRKSPSEKKLTTETSIDTLIENGLRAKLNIQSFVTGQLLVAFDFYPDTQINLSGLEDDLRELPTLPSDMEALARTFDTLDLPGLVESIKNTATGIEELVNSVDLQALAATANQTLKGYLDLAEGLNQRVASLTEETSATLADARRLLRTAEGRIPPMAEGIAETAADIKRTVAALEDRLQPVMANIETAAGAARDALVQAQAMMTNLTDLSDENSLLVYRLNETLTEAGKAARALALLADYLHRHPESLLQGKQALKENR